MQDSSLLYVMYTSSAAVSVCIAIFLVQETFNLGDDFRNLRLSSQVNTSLEVHNAVEHSEAVLFCLSH